MIILGKGDTDQTDEQKNETKNSYPTFHGYLPVIAIRRAPPSRSLAESRLSLLVGMALSALD
jgi:hypothetical protein